MVVWKLAAKAEALAKGNSFYGAVSVVLKRMCDMLGRDRLVARAFSHGLPWHFGAVSIASYRWPRRVVLQVHAGGVLHATRGVAPGCAVACTWVKLAMIDGLDTLVTHLALRSRKLAALNLHVDDLAIATAADTSSEAANTLGEALSHFAEFVERELNGQVAAPKLR